MHILLCHHRFTFRFGVDRVLVALAREFRRLGHRVTFLGYQIDVTCSEAADRIIRLPECENYYQLDVESLRWLERNWDQEFSGPDRPDVVMTAGWPFVSAVSFFRRRSTLVFYQDHGIIPSENVPENGKRALALLGDLKRTFVPQASGLIAVSKFVLESQSRACVTPGQLATVILNGADHVSRGLRSRRSSGEPRILVLGRFEPGTYKRSELAFELERLTREWVPGAWFGVFATPEELGAVAPPGSQIESLGHVDDRRMSALIESCDATVSVSAWEGFNLPLAESQILGVPSLVFDCGAHAEVVANSWQLCVDIEEMAKKLRILIEGHAPASIQDGSDFSAYSRSRSWTSVAEAYLAFFAEAKAKARSQVNPWASSDREVFIMDVTNACRDPANSGCVRVARRLAEQLQDYHAVLFVVWDRFGGVFRFPSSAEFLQLSSFQGPTFAVEHPVSGDASVRNLTDWLAGNQVSSGWLIMPEIRHREDFLPILDFALKVSLRTAAIFHDAIPVLRPDLVADPIYREGHEEYMKVLACCDLVVAISHFSEDCLRKFWEANSLAGRAMTCLLPGGFTGHRSVDKVPVGSNDPKQRRTILCVSTLEPRKNHLRLIESFLALEAETPEFSWELVLVGSEIHSAPELAQSVKQSAREHPSVKYLGIVPDERLAQLYEECEFTVYPSVIEGFGLPIMESVWYSRPCLCHKGGVMEELASEGGCLAVDLQDTAEMTKAMRRLMTDPALRERLREECRKRPVKRWSDYAAEFLALLAQIHRSELEHYTPSI